MKNFKLYAGAAASVSVLAILAVTVPWERESVTGEYSGRANLSAEISHNAPLTGGDALALSAATPESLLQTAALPSAASLTIELGEQSNALESVAQRPVNPESPLNVASLNTMELTEASAAYRQVSVAQVVSRAASEETVVTNDVLPTDQANADENVADTEVTADRVKGAVDAVPQFGLESQFMLASSQSFPVTNGAVADDSVPEKWASPVQPLSTVTLDSPVLLAQAEIETETDRPGNTPVRDLAREIKVKMPESPIVSAGIAVDFPLPGSITNNPAQLVTGVVDITPNLLRVVVNGVDATVNKGAFSVVVPLVAGYNDITASAEFIRGSRTDKTDTTLDTEKPSVVNAISSSSTGVLVQFDEPMHEDSILNAANFNITRDDTQSSMPVLAASFNDASSTVVLLKTGHQSNTAYTLSVASVKDLAGNPLKEPSRGVNPSIAQFIGTSPGGSEIVDSDGDGMLDHIELAGWLVVIQRTDGGFESLHVSSDPFLKDTDGDDIEDAEERNAGLNPRNSDTDGDTLSDDDEWNRVYSDPTHQDTDGDGLPDGLEVNFFSTSPLLADTDGDQIEDFDELVAANRNPLIADLPSPNIVVGNVNMQLDTRFSYTDEAGAAQTTDKSVETTLSQSEDKSFSSSNEQSTSNTLGFSQDLSATYSAGGGADEAFPKYSVTAAAGAEQGSERGSTVSFGEESSRSSEEAYNESLTTSVARDIRESVTREVVDATIRVDLTIDNDGDIPFTISNLELTAQTQDPTNRRKIIPVASLVPENENLGSVNIGALGDPSRGPFVFKTESIFPQQVEELMKNPRGFIVQLANYDITDQDGNNFAFTSQTVLDRTAGITFDLGDGRTESYRVATASDFNRASGRPSGISMARAFEIIGLNRYAVIRDGGNGLVETTAAASDEQQAQIFRPVEPGSIVISAGEDGTIETVPAGDDVLTEPDYETDESRTQASIVDGGNGVAETTVDAEDDEISAVGSAVQPGQIIARAGVDNVLDSVPGGDDKILPASPPRKLLIRYLDVEAKQDEKRFWALFASQDRPGTDLDDFQIRSGEQFDFAFVQDKDQDGVWAREEYLHGSSDLLVNTDGCDRIPLPDPCDTLTDATEIQLGWQVTLKGSPQGYRVYPNPNQADSDRDQLLDHVEQACQLDPRLRDTDLDGLTDWEELNGKRILDDGTEEDMKSRDPIDNEVTYTITPYKGLKGELVPHESIAACDDLLIMDGFATDPLKADTDGDLVNDLLELQLGINPNDSLDGPLFLDDDGDGVANKLETDGYDAIINGATVTVTSNPNDPDSDDDGLPDLLERFLKSNPRSKDTDDDGLSDANEYGKAGEACITVVSGAICTKFQDLIDENFQDFVRECAAADVCDNADIETKLTGIGAKNYATNLSEEDTDFDGRKDGEELGPLEIIVNGGRVPLDPASNPLRADTEGDGVNDGDEFTAGSNPNESDTDGDGTEDSVEIATIGGDAHLVRNPSYEDKLVTVTTDKYIVYHSNEVGGVDPVWFADVSHDGGTYTEVCRESADNIDILPPDNTPIEVPFSSECIFFERVFSADPANPVSIRIRSDGYESDGAGEAGSVVTCDAKTVTFNFGLNTTDGDELEVDHSNCRDTSFAVKLKFRFKLNVSAN